MDFIFPKDVFFISQRTALAEYTFFYEDGQERVLDEGGGEDAML